MIALFAATVRAQSSFDDSGETQVGTRANPQFLLLAGAIEEFHGTVLSPAAEEIHAEFAEASMAVRAATEMQRRLQKVVANRPEAERPLLRVGIHQSNRATAERIGKQAKPGQVLIARDVRDAILNDVDVRCTWQGQLAGATPSEKEDLFEVLWAAPGAAITRPGVSGTAPVFERFEVLGELGRGGMGIVYKARDRETGETVAVKVLKSDLLENPNVIERFKNEMRLARKITHKNVCRIHDFHRTGDAAYISMEFVEGESLRELLERRKVLPVEEGLAIAAQICSGLREAHAQGVVHRDLKPQNVMVDSAGRVKLMDFGIARSVDSTSITLTVGIVGTPAYMAPEQAEGKPVDHRTDIYAVGLVLYEIFTGVPAFSGETAVTVIMKQITELPRPPRQVSPELPAVIERTILGCLEKSPDRRFASIGDVEAALGGDVSLPAAVATVQIPAPPEAATPTPPAVPPARKWWKTAIGITAMGCAVPTLIVCMMVVILALWSGRKKKQLPADPVPASVEAPAAPPAKPSRGEGKKNKKSGVTVEPPAPATPPSIQVPGIPGGLVIPSGPEFAKQVKEIQFVAWITKGDRFMEQKNYPAAISMYQMALGIHPDNQEVKDKLAKARQGKEGK